MGRRNFSDEHYGATEDEVIESLQEDVAGLYRDCRMMAHQRDQYAASLERIKVAFQALRDAKEHASSKLYRVLAAEFPAVTAPKLEAGKE
jgi:hypothetical protein